MQERPKQRVVVNDFTGMNEDVDPHDPGAGAGVEQVNCCSLKPGQLEVRRGYALVSFE